MKANFRIRLTCKCTVFKMHCDSLIGNKILFSVVLTNKRQTDIEEQKLFYGAGTINYGSIIFYHTLSLKDRVCLSSELQVFP